MCLLKKNLLHYFTMLLFFFAVMEKLNGGELFDRLCEIKTYNEKDARDAMRIIFEAMAYCHSRQVAHR